MSNRRNFDRAKRAMDEEMRKFSASFAGETPERETVYQSGKHIKNKKRKR